MRVDGWFLFSRPQLKKIRDSSGRDQQTPKSVSVSDLPQIDTCVCHSLVLVRGHFCQGRHGSFPSLVQELGLSQMAVEGCRTKLLTSQTRGFLSFDSYRGGYDVSPKTHVVKADASPEMLGVVEEKAQDRRDVLDRS